MKKLGVLTQTDRMGTRELQDFALRVEDLGFESLWLPELFGREPIATAGFLLNATTRLKIATGIANIYCRDPHAMALARSTLAELSEGRFMLGLGVSNDGLNGSRGHEWQMPLPKMRQYLTDMANAIDQSPPPENPAPLYIAAHGPKLQTLGSEQTDGIITYLMPPEHTERSRTHVGPATSITVTCAFLAETDAQVARSKARKGLKYYLTLDYYQREWQKLGFNDSDYTNGGSDRLIDTLVAWGSEDQLFRRINAFKEAGAERVIVMPFDVLGEGDSLSVLSNYA